MKGLKCRVIDYVGSKEKKKKKSQITVSCSKECTTF